MHREMAKLDAAQITFRTTTEMMEAIDREVERLSVDAHPKAQKFRQPEQQERRPSHPQGSRPGGHHGGDARPGGTPVRSCLVAGRPRPRPGWPTAERARTMAPAEKEEGPEFTAPSP